MDMVNRSGDYSHRMQSPGFYAKVFFLLFMQCDHNCRANLHFLRRDGADEDDA